MSSRRFDRIVAAVVMMAVALTVLMMAMPDVFSAAEAVSMLYEEKVFGSGGVIDLNITVDEAAWADLLKNAINEEYIECDVTVNGYTVLLCGIRAKGNSSLSSVYSSDSNRYSFKIEFDQYVSGQSLYGLDKLALNNIYSDATYMKEYLSYMMFESMGVNTPLYTFANVTVNGEPWGLYLAVECIETSFAIRNYGTDYGNIYKPETSGMGNINRLVVNGEEITRENQGNWNPILTEGEWPEFDPNVEGNGFGGRQWPGNAVPDATDPSAQGDTAVPPDGVSQALPGDITQLPEGFQPPEDITQLPEGFQLQEGQMPDINDDRIMLNSMSGGGADLVYTDDEFDSYSAIFDNLKAGTSSSSAKRKLIAALKALSEGNEIENYIDVDEVLRYFAVNTVLVNLDHYTGSMQHNYYLYEKDGVLSMLPWDYNLAFGGFSMTDVTSAVNFPIDTPVQGTTLEARPMLGKLLENEEYLALYHSYLKEIMETWFDSGLLVDTINTVSDMIGEYVKSDATAFYTYDQFLAGVETLKTFVQLRGESINGQLDGSIPSTSEGQSADSSSLIDASGINLSQMGSQGGGGGMVRGDWTNRGGAADAGDTANE